MVKAKPLNLDEPLNNDEAHVINATMALAGIQVDGAPEHLDAKRRAVQFKDAKHVALSFCRLDRIAHLAPFASLTKLCLDNNRIRVIENLSHLTHLERLDLSFNEITKIENLDALTKLNDLSLFNNKIRTIEGMDAFRKTLSTLSLGNNELDALEQLSPLTAFKEIRVLNLGGNGACKDPEYRAFVLSHVKGLKYLDHRVVKEEHAAAAREQYQDEMIELEEREETDAHKALLEKEAAAREATYVEANVSGISELFERMMRDDPEYAKLKEVPNPEHPELMQELPMFREKWIVFVEEFKDAMARQLERKKKEHSEWKTVVDGALGEGDERARVAVAALEDDRKRAFQTYGVMVELAEGEEIVTALDTRSDDLCQELMDMELRNVEIVKDLVFEFDREYTEIVSKSKTIITEFFEKIRELEENYFAGLQEEAMRVYERFGSGELDDACSEDTKLLLGDKDTFMNSVQSHHDFHASAIDALEDKLAKEERRRLDELIDGIRDWERDRNRVRVAEIVAMKRRNKEALDVEYESEPESEKEPNSDDEDDESDDDDDGDGDGGDE